MPKEAQDDEFLYYYRLINVQVTIMAEPRQRRTEGPSRTDQLLNIIERLPQAVSPTHPTRPANAQAGADTLLKLGEILTIMRGEQPREGTDGRRVWDAAVRAWGNRDEAVNTLGRAFAEVAHDLRGREPTRSDVGDSAQPLERMLAAEETRLTGGDLRLEPAWSDISRLLSILRGGQAQAQVATTDRPAAREPLPLIEQQLRDMGPIHLISSSRNSTVVSFGGRVTQDSVLLFGSEANAQGTMTALGNAYATLANHPNDPQVQAQAAQALRDALSQIPANKEIWQSANFTSAMADLQRGDLRSALDKLSREGLLQTFFANLNNLYVVSVNQRAISVMRAGVTVKYEFERNVEAFTEFMRGAQRGEFQPRLLWLATGLHYEYLLMSGQLTQYAAEGSGVREVSRQRLTGTGHVFGVTPQIAFGLSAWQYPIEAVLHCNFGYRTYELGTDVPTPGGGTQRVGTSDQSFYVGVWGAEIRFPGREGQRSIIRVPRINIGAVGSPVNPYASFTLAGRWLENNTMRIESEITPQFSYFLDQPRVGGEVRPIDFSIRLDREGQNFLFFGPGFRYDYNIATGGHTLDGSGSVGFRFGRGVHIDLRGGVVGEVGGSEVDRLPTSGYGSLNLTITPQHWILGGGVPRRRGER